MNISDLMTSSDLAEELGVSVATANGITKDLPVVMKVARTKLFSREAVKSALRERHQNVLQFLGVRPEGESYDTVISDDVSTSEEEV